MCIFVVFRKHIQLVVMKNQPIKFGDESLSDAVIIVNDQEFHVHKLVNSFIIKVKFVLVSCLPIGIFQGSVLWRIQRCLFDYYCYLKRI